MNWKNLTLSGIFCFSFILMALYVAGSELLYYWKFRNATGENLTSLKKVRLRLLTCMILITVMVMIFTGVNFLKFSHPQGFLTYWGICSALVFFLFVFPLLDIRETTRLFMERKKTIIKDMEKSKNPYEVKKHYLN
ncbi:MAG TPA: hypothetical protein PL110_06010 [Candidatus Eremiobacteraeota bacterium]|nr:MAG: hypothetical protein BWY64_00142 [bacterium ADurb.Bin363]HPZ07648.1 hypothetical protein [Candidatus Eremiobacteraeota bacterium]